MTSNLHSILESGQFVDTNQVIQILEDEGVRRSFTFQFEFLIFLVLLLFFASQVEVV